MKTGINELQYFQEAINLLKKASTLVGNPCTNISGSTDVACMKWQDEYNDFMSKDSTMALLYADYLNNRNQQEETK